MFSRELEINCQPGRTVLVISSADPHISSDSHVLHIKDPVGAANPLQRTGTGQDDATGTSTSLSEEEVTVWVTLAPVNPI